MVTKVSFHAMIQNFLFMRLKDSSMVYAPGFEQCFQGFHIMQILDIEKNLGVVVNRRSRISYRYIYIYACVYLVIVRKPD